MQTQAPSVAEIFGPATWTHGLSDVADHLADQMLTHHWHVDEMPWNALPLFPIEESEKGSRRLIRFYKSVTAVSTRAEEVAVSIARRLLLYANEEKLAVPFRRALAALLNDEASHVATMIKLEQLADKEFPDISARTDESPLFRELMPAIETLHPAVLAVFMGSYEASVAIRSYSEQQTYPLPSILATMGAHAAEDDGRHAKTLRIVAHEFLRIFRSRHGDDENGTSPAWRTQILEPFRRFWSLMPAHEYYLAGSDRRQLSHVRKQVDHDIVIMTRILDFLSVSAQAQEYAGVAAIANQLPE
ncbi:MAG: hypothetical protein JO219_13425 [Candidatus Eremiobacteraeota bacterium]|nr:hypothetical protein [Candidatus Eremiobacteraeota bacterium]